MKPKVYITRKIQDEVVNKISLECDVRMWKEVNSPVPREVLEDEIEEMDGLFCLLTETIDAQLLSKSKRLKVVSNMAVGYNNIDIEAATKKGIMVTNTPGVLTETTADLTFALLMATARRIVESSDYIRDGKWRTWSPMLLAGQDVYGTTLGIIGLGRIGEALVKRAKGFDMNVLYYSRNRKQEVEERCGIVYAEMGELLAKSDFICVMTPYTKDTHYLIGQRELSMMKKSAILINTARGGIVDEQALYQALKENRIWGAGLDVFENEPISPDHPLLNLPNVVSIPHIGSASIKTRIRMAHLAADNLIQVLKGETPKHPVNPLPYNY